MQTPPPEVIVFDLETTGFSPRWHEIIQIAAARLGPDGATIDTFSTYIRPSRAIPAHITELTGIADADVADAPHAPEALRAFARFIADAGPAATLVAHNGHRFDLRFITETCARHGLVTQPIAFIDSLWLSKKLWPGESLHNLDAITDRLDLDVTESRHPRHDARTDVLLLATVLRGMVRKLFPVAPAKQLQAEAREYDFIATA